MKPIYTFRSSTQLERARRRDLVHQEMWAYSVAGACILIYLVAKAVMR